MQKNPGFTIVEILIVVIVIAILATVSIVSFNGVTANARWTAKQALAENINNAVSSRHTLGGAYPNMSTVALPGVESAYQSQYVYTEGPAFDTESGDQRYCGSTPIQDKLCIEPLSFDGLKIVGYGIIAYNDTKGCWVGAAGTSDSDGVREFIVDANPSFSDEDVDGLVRMISSDISALPARLATADCQFGSDEYPSLPYGTYPCQGVYPRASNLYGKIPVSC